MSSKAASAARPLVSLFTKNTTKRPQNRLRKVASECRSYSRAALLESLRSNTSESAPVKGVSAFNVRQGTHASSKKRAPRETTASTSASSAVDTISPAPSPLDSSSFQIRDHPRQFISRDASSEMLETALVSKHITSARTAVRQLLKQHSARISSSEQTRYFELLASNLKEITFDDLVAEVTLFESEGWPLSSTAMSELTRGFFLRKEFSRAIPVAERMRKEAWKTRGTDLGYDNAKYIIALYAGGGHWEEAISLAQRARKPTVVHEMHIRRAHAENQIDLAYDLLLQLPAQYNNITLSVLEPAVFSLVGRTLLDSKEPEKVSAILTTWDMMGRPPAAETTIAEYTELRLRYYASTGQDTLFSTLLDMPAAQNASTPLYIMMLHAARGYHDKVISTWKTYESDTQLHTTEVFATVLDSFIHVRPKYQLEMIAFLKKYSHRMGLKLESWARSIIPALDRGDLATLIAEFGEGPDLALAGILKYSRSHVLRLSASIERMIEELPAKAWEIPVVRHEMALCIDVAEKPLPRLKHLHMSEKLPQEVMKALLTDLIRCRFQRGDENGFRYASLWRHLQIPLDAGFYSTLMMHLAETNPPELVFGGISLERDLFPPFEQLPEICTNLVTVYAKKGEVKHIVETLRIAAAEMNKYSLRLPSSFLQYCVQMLCDQPNLPPLTQMQLKSLSRRLSVCRTSVGRAPVFGLLIDLGDVLKSMSASQ